MAKHADRDDQPDDHAGMLAWHVNELRKACAAVDASLGPDAGAEYRQGLTNLIRFGTATRIGAK